jgi:hypothetical protein
MHTNHIFLDGFNTDAITGECHSPSGAFAFTRDAAGLIVVHDKHGHRSTVGATQAAAEHLVFSFAPDASEMGDEDDFNNEVFQFVNLWDRMVPGAEIAVSFDPVSHSKWVSGAYVLTESNGAMTVTNLGALNFGNDPSFGVIRTASGSFHMFVSQHRPDNQDLTTFADELAVTDFGVNQERWSGVAEFINHASMFLRSCASPRFSPHEAVG